MHPARSVILFTTASGAGYGVVTVLALLDWLGAGLTGTGPTIAVFGLALGLIVAGLVSSTFHLGRPERAWRAMSQWRSSWLSREGLAAIVSLAVIGSYGLVRLVLGSAHGGVLATAALAAIVSMATVHCTAMIYASLRPVAAWSTAWTPVAYAVLALMSGAVLYHAVAVFGGGGSGLSASLALAMTLGGLAAKTGYWWHTGASAPVSTPETATGLGRFGRVRLLEAPHTEDNYLMKEMVYEIARKHASRLRALSVAVGFVVPLAAIAAAQLSGRGAPAAAAIAVAAMAAGLLVERWLFFAEAKHTVGLYYGAR